MHQKDKITIIFNSQVTGVGMGGGDKIVLNISRHLTKNFDIFYLCCPEGKDMVDRELGRKFVSNLINNSSTRKTNFILVYLLRIFNLSFLKNKIYQNSDIIWSSSDFLPDTYIGLWGKLVSGKRWFGNLFLRARNPFIKEVNLSIRTLLYFLSQKISILLYKYFADHVFVLSEADKKYLLSCGIKKVTILSGGVDMADVDRVIVQDKKFDACFVGRFHYQKGLPDLIAVWSRLCQKNPKLILSVIGSGIPEEVAEVNMLVSKYRLEKNIILNGYLDGHEKYKVIKQSKLLLFPSSFESWGVVVAEGIACGTPVVAFALPEIKDNFHHGVVWVENGNIKKYKDTVESLLSNTNERNKVSQDALKHRYIYDWQNSANIFLSAASR